MINMAFMPLYMWEMWDVTPVTNARTHGRTVESRAVFSLSWIRNTKNHHAKIFHQKKYWWQFPLLVFLCFGLYIIPMYDVEDCWSGHIRGTGYFLLSTQWWSCRSVIEFPYLFSSPLLCIWFFPLRFLQQSKYFSIFNSQIIELWNVVWIVFFPLTKSVICTFLLDPPFPWWSYRSIIRFLLHWFPFFCLENDFLYVADSPPDSLWWSENCSREFMAKRVLVVEGAVGPNVWADPFTKPHNVGTVGQPTPVHNVHFG